MIIFKKNKDIGQQLDALRKAGKTIAFVPTMGALHEGHLSLIGSAKQLADITVCSIFVNPTQFNDKEDFEKYPITIDKDIEKLIHAAVDILFLPDVEEIYPENDPLNQLQNQTIESYHLGHLETILEGAYRPGHFQGVCQVIDRLLSIIQPGYLVMGQKDYQQTLVIRRLLALKESETELVIVPTLREAGGLAMSSRNTRLDANQHSHAEIIHAALLVAKTNLPNQPWDGVRSEIADKLLKGGFDKYDYIELCKTTDLARVNAYSPTSSLIILVAAYMGKIRLIDNILL